MAGGGETAGEQSLTRHRRSASSASCGASPPRPLPSLPSRRQLPPLGLPQPAALLSQEPLPSAQAAPQETSGMSSFEQIWASPAMTPASHPKPRA